MRLLTILFLLQIIVLVFLVAIVSFDGTYFATQTTKIEPQKLNIHEKNLTKLVCKKSKKTPSPIVVKKQSAKNENPNAIKDRKRLVRYKPAYPESWGMEKRHPFSPAWMDYCAPYHCGDYHKLACGLNRRRMKFQWFQSGCHLVLNNKCANYRGFLKFDQVDPRYCRAYVMFALRSGCPETCSNTGSPVCAVNVDTNKAVVFKNICYLYMKNCQGVMQDFVELPMNVCLNDIDLVVEALEEMTTDELTKNKSTSDELTQTEEAVNNSTEEIGDEVVKLLENKYFIA